MPLLPLHKRSFILLLIAVTAAFIWFYRNILGNFLGRRVCHRLFPFHKRVVARMPNKPTLAAILTLLLSLFVVILPMVLISLSLVKETSTIYERINSGNTSVGSYLQQIFNALPSWLTPWLEKLHLGTLEEMQSKLQYCSAGQQAGRQQSGRTGPEHSGLCRRLRRDALSNVLSAA